jgi:hypothetical protein
MEKMPGLATRCRSRYALLVHFAAVFNDGPEPPGFLLLPGISKCGERAINTVTVTSRI